MLSSVAKAEKPIVMRKKEVDMMSRYVPRFATTNPARIDTTAEPRTNGINLTPEMIADAPRIW